MRITTSVPAPGRLQMSTCAPIFSSPLLHVGEATWPIGFAEEGFGVDAHSVVAEEDAELVRPVVQLGFDTTRLRVVEGVAEGFASEALQLFEDSGMQAFGHADDEDLEVRAAHALQLLTGGGVSERQILGGGRLRMAVDVKVAAFRHNSVGLLKSLLEDAACRVVRSEQGGAGVEAEKKALHALEEVVVPLAGEALAPR